MTERGTSGAPLRRYTVIGTGAIGGYYGARLARAGHRVCFLARSDADHLRTHGLRVESPDGDLSLADVEVYDDPDDVPDADVVVLAVKTTDTDAVLDHLPGLVADGTAILALQNGLGVERPVASAVPGTTVLGGMCFVCSNKIGPGHIRHLDYGTVTVGQHTDDGSAAGITPLVDAIASDLERAGLPVQRIEHLVAGRWRKLVWNIPYNGLSVVLDAGTDELMADPNTRELVEALMAEVVTGAHACGIEIDAEFVDDMVRTTDRMTPYKTSMKLDYEGGRPLELDAIYRAPLEAARTAGFEMTRTAALHAQLQFLERRRRHPDQRGVDTRPDARPAPDAE